ncbi:PfkB family carbohydrate kinase [Mangrovicoccus ximenensis]|uniref:PfkB family carbohydrate kinase n=1 Tax=Mangrovicoccus ximenensis TaxID=1911570 RepID=UPI0038B3E4DF
MIPNRHILCIGSALWDTIGYHDQIMAAGHDRPGRIRRVPGGVALNIAIALARLGMFPQVLTVLGTDPEGDTLLPRPVARHPSRHAEPAGAEAAPGPPFPRLPRSAEGLGAGPGRPEQWRDMARSGKPGPSGPPPGAWTHLWMPAPLQGTFFLFRHFPRLRASIRPVVAMRPAPPALMPNPQIGSQSLVASPQLDASNGFDRSRSARSCHHVQNSLASAAAQRQGTLSPQEIIASP